MSRFTGVTSEHPRALSLVVCDRIIIDERTKKRSLIDIFDTVTASKVPTLLPRMCIFVSVARGEAETSELYLGLFDPTGHAMVQSVLTVNNWGQGQADFDFILSPVGFTSAGVYDLRLFVADAVLAQRNLVVQITPPPQEEQADSPTP